jgi:hypothetical protein
MQISIITCDGRSGADLTFSPDLKYSVTGEYVMEMNGMDIYFNSSYVYTDEILWARRAAQHKLTQKRFYLNIASKGECCIFV